LNRAFQTLLLLRGFLALPPLSRSFLHKQRASVKSCPRNSINFLESSQDMKPKNFLIIGAFFAVAAICLPPRSDAKSKGSPSPDAESSAASSADASAAASGKVRATPFRGMIASVDDKAKTITIAGKDTSRVLKVTDRTIITKAGQPATMKEVVANEEVRGSYYKMPDGSMEAKFVKLGPLTEAEKAEREARKAKREEKRAGISPGASVSPSVSPGT